MKLEVAGESYTLVVTGDFSGNGKVDISDLQKVKMILASIIKPAEKYEKDVTISNLVDMKFMAVELKDVIAPRSFTPQVINKTNNSITIKGDTIDDGGEVVEYYFKINNGEWVSNTDKTKSTYTFENLENESYIVRMKVKDDAGNEKITKGIKIGMTNPISIFPSIVDWTNKDVLVSVNYNTSIGNVKKLISIDNGNTFKEYTGPVKISKNTKIVARTVSEENAVMEEEELNIQNIDKIAPKEFTITTTVDKQKVRINANTDDEEKTQENGKSGIKEYEYTIKSGLWKWTEVTKENTFEFYMLRSGEKYTVQVTAIDNAGNKTTSEEVEIQIERKSKLTVNPNGGIWESLENIQQFEQDKGTTKEISEPTREGYTFKGWEVTKGGQIAGNLYTYGEFDTTITAKWEINQYTVTFNANGGNADTEKIKQDYDTSISLPGAEQRGYKFKGWYSDEACTDANKVGDVGDNYTIKTNVMLYAKWGKNEHTTEDGNKITFETDGGEETLGEIEETEDGAIILPEPTKEGYTFDGWYSDEACTEGNKIGDAGDEYKPEGDTTIYAKWKINQYTVTFNANGGNADTKKIKQDYDTSISLPGAEQRGYKFKGWYSDEACTDANKVGDVGDNYTIKTNVMLYAKWGKNEHTTEDGNKITFETDGGEESLGEIEETEDGAIILPNPTKEGYTFEGWYKDEAYTMWIGKAGDKYKPEGDSTLYAKWKINQYTVTFNANGGKVDPESIEEDYNTTITLPGAEQRGYKFKGWYSNSECTDANKVGDVGDNYTIKTNVMLYAKWGKNEHTTEDGNKITFETDGGEESLGEIEETEDGAIILPNPTKEGYTFEGWYKDEAYTMWIGKAGDKYKPEGDSTLYAKWSINQYTVTFNANGGEVDPRSIDKDYNTIITLPRTVKEGYKLKGWYSDSECTDANKVGDAEDNYTIKTNVMLYAKWGKNEHTTEDGNKITFETDGGEETLGEIEETEDGAIILPNPTKEGYTFEGWYKDEACTDKIGDAGDRYKPEGDTTIYAKWEINIQ